MGEIRLLGISGAGYGGGGVDCHHVQVFVRPPTAPVDQGYCRKKKNKKRMEEFFEGLDSKLRISGKVADSIMMGIVNSAMNEAYEKSCSKEGDLERLNEKSRFCELASIQLEWCLKFLEEEIDNNFIESSEKEKLFFEISETKNKILSRLEETEFTIAEKDKELIIRKKNEMNLRMALEGKDDEIVYLYGANEIERQKSERLHVFLRSSSMSEAKKSIDQDIRGTRRKLDEVHEQLEILMQKLTTSSSGTKKLETEIHVNHDSSDTNFDLDQLKEEFQEIFLQFEILKENMKCSFETVENCMSLFEATIADQQWKWNVERETTNIVTKSFLKDIKYKFDEILDSPDDFCVKLLDDITGLHKELEMLLMQKEIQPIRSHLSPSVSVRAKDNISLKVKAFLENDEFGLSTRKDDNSSRESSPGNFAPEMIRNHKFMMSQKFEENSCSKEGNVKQKMYTDRKDNDIDIEAMMLEQIYAILFKGLLENSDELMQTLYSQELKPLKQDNKDMVVEVLAMEEIHANLFKWMVKRFISEFYDFALETHINQDVCMVAFHEFLKAWKVESETWDSERTVVEDVNHITIKETLNDVKDGINLFLRKCESKNLVRLSKSIDVVSSSEFPLNYGDEIQNKDVSGSMMETQSHLRFMTTPLLNFYQVIMDFEFIACEKMRMNTSRLEDLHSRLSPLVEQVKTTKKDETLYRKAFTRRCYDLQTAEEEVDLLGDQVDLFLNLLQKIYVSLDVYSPVLKYYNEIMDVLNLIQTVLNEEQISSSTH